MGRLIVEQMVSADGFAAGPRGSLDHLQPSDDPARTVSQLRTLETVDAILLGRRTYRLFEQHWPTRSAASDPLAEPINRLPKHVVSNTLRHAPWGDWSSATVEPGEPRDTVRRLKAHYRGDVIVWGSLTLTGALLQARQVDRLRLHVVPVVLGEGWPFTPGLRDARHLDLLEVEAFETGHAVMTYDVR